MCGIFAYLGAKTNAGDLILNGLKSLEYRGYDSWGIAIKQSNGKLYVEKHAGKIGQSSLKSLVSNVGIGHTRWATHGGVTDNNAHPHLDCQKKIVVVHNGIVENFQQLRNKLIKTGHKFKSETDSETIAHLLEEHLQSCDDRTEIVNNVFHQLQGLNAIIVFFPEFEEFYAIKNSSPLVFRVDQLNKQYFLSSDYAGIVNHANNHLCFLEDNELLVIKKTGFNLYNSRGKAKKPLFIKMSYKTEDLNKGKYRHYMIKEISEQPNVLTNIINTQRKTIETAAQIIQKSYGSYLIGCGTAYYAALAGTYLFSKIAKRHINDSVGSEFSYLVDFLKETSLVIALSQSGETIDTIASVKKAQEKKARIMTITNSLGSTLYRLSDYKILLNAGPEKCVLATKSFTAKVAILYLLAYSLNGGYQKGTIQIKKAVTEVEKLIRFQQIKKIAHQLKNRQHIYVLGRGVSYPTALESALKIKEVSYIHAEAFAGGELKHGVIALIEKNTPIIIYNPEDETYDDTLSSAYEVKARGGYIIGVSNKTSPVYDQFIKVNTCQEATVIPNVVVAQLLGYYLALAKGLDPDKPRNLAKSVTVK